MPDHTSRSRNSARKRTRAAQRRGSGRGQSAPRSPDRVDLSAPISASSAERVIALQSARGNQYVQRLLVQRNGDGADVAAPVVPPKPMIDKAKSIDVLKKSFEDYKEIAGGKVEVYDQAGFEEAWDKVYGETQYAWDTYVKPGNLEGFAHGGTNYINKDTGSVDVVPHEMLHSNTSGSWTPFAGSETNEGTTEYLTIKAVTAEGYTASHSYPNQEGVVQVLVGVVGEAKLMGAYFKGETDAVKTAMESVSKGTWAQFKTAMQAKQWVRAKALLDAK